VGECFTGTTDARPALQQMMTDARSGQLDALVIHKWDHLARSRLDAVR
jgi:DNA invertase Pin-like site-specific DNA recombinase